MVSGVLKLICFLGIIFYPNEDGDVTDIQADIIGPRKYSFTQPISLFWFSDKTPFEGGVFRCKLTIDGDFPNVPPKGFFLTKIFHPNVATPNGDICVSTLKKDWDPTKWSLSHIF